MIYTSLIEAIIRLVRDFRNANKLNAADSSDWNLSPTSIHNINQECFNE